MKVATIIMDNVTVELEIGKGVVYINNKEYSFYKTDEVAGILHCNSGISYDKMSRVVKQVEENWVVG